MSIIWLSSYPKSGNTWVRTLITAYLNGGVVDINKMHGTPMGASKQLLERQLGASIRDLGDPEAEALRPKAYRNLSQRFTARTGRPAITKVHDIFKLTARGEPLFPPEITKATIYIVRDPRDATVSMAHHLGIPMEKATEWICHENFCLMSVGDEAQKTQVRQLLRSWRSHVLSWLDQKAMPVHLVKYEDLHSSPEVTFTKILQAMEIPIDAALVTKSIHACRFPALQAQELLTRFNEKAKKADAPFFRSGKIGDYRSDLTPMQIARILEKNGDVMRRLGYL